MSQFNHACPELNTGRMKSKVSFWLVFETYSLFKKKPPKIINGRRIGICRACACSGVLATTERTEPTPTDAKLVKIIMPTKIKNRLAELYKFAIQ